MQKALHIAIIIVIIVAIIFTAFLLALRYEEKGEVNMPFNISKISIISTVNAQDVKDDKNMWNKLVDQENDIYIYIDKNETYTKTETIQKIVLDNFQIIQEPEKGKISIYKPSKNKDVFFENIDEYRSEEITYLGDQSTDMKKLQISNQGGIIQFRVSIEGLGEFISNDKSIKELHYEELLKKINIAEEQLKAKISFDINIVLATEKQFEATIEVDIPTENIIELGKSSKEFTDLEFVFKRVEN